MPLTARVQRMVMQPIISSASCCVRNSKPGHVNCYHLCVLGGGGGGQDRWSAGVGGVGGFRGREGCGCCVAGLQAGFCWDPWGPGGGVEEEEGCYDGGDGGIGYEIEPRPQLVVFL